MQAHALFQRNDDVRVRSSVRLETLTCELGAAFVVVFAVIVLVRLAYPFEVSWMESAMYEMVIERLRGRSMYVPPSIDYTPCLYPPLYFDVSAVVARALGLAGTISFLPMRLVSVAASLGVFAVTSLVVYRKKGSVRWAIGFGAVFLATYGRFEGWHDNARVDALHAFLVVASVALLLEGRGLGSACAAGVYSGAAILTKQPAALLMGLVITQTIARERSLRRGGTTFVTALGIVLAYLTLTREIDNPWLYHYLFAVPASHPLRAVLLFKGIFFLPVTTPILCAVVIVSLPALRREGLRAFDARRPWTTTLLLWFVLLAALRSKQGASINFFLPLVPVAIVAAVEAADRLMRGGSRFAPLLPYVPAAQLLALLYDPRPYVPTFEDAREAHDLVQRLRQVEGPVWVPAFPSYAALAGKPWFAHEVALGDLAQTHPGLVWRSLDERIARRAFGGLVVPPRTTFVASAALADYRLESLPVPQSTFLAVLQGNHLGAGIFVPQ